MLAAGGCSGLDHKMRNCTGNGVQAKQHRVGAAARLRGDHSDNILGIHFSKNVCFRVNLFRKLPQNLMVMAVQAPKKNCL